MRDGSNPTRNVGVGLVYPGLHCRIGFRSDVEPRPARGVACERRHNRLVCDGCKWGIAIAPARKPPKCHITAHTGHAVAQRRSDQVSSFDANGLGGNRPIRHGFCLSVDVWYRSGMPDFMNFGIAMAIKGAVVTYLNERRLRLATEEAERATHAKPAKVRIGAGDSVPSPAQGIRTVKGHVLQDTVDAGDVAEK